MRKSIPIAAGAALILGVIGLAVFGSALAQPPFQLNGFPQVTQADDAASCHIGGAIAGGREHMLGLLAEALGISEVELTGELDAGKSLKDIAAAQGHDDAEVAAALNGAMRDAMQRHLQDGLLSQDQADEMLEHMEQMGPSHLTDMLNGQMPASMMDGQGHGMMSGQDHGAMMGGQGHGGMMGGQGHESMMGGQSHGSTTGSSADDSAGGCPTDSIPSGQQL